MENLGLEQDTSTGQPIGAFTSAIRRYGHVIGPGVVCRGKCGLRSPIRLSSDWSQ